MRIAVGQMWQESNTFNRNLTRWENFEHWGVAVGADIFPRFGDTGELGGFLSACRQWPEPPRELIGLARFACWPWGAVESATARRILATFDEQLRIAGPLDAVFLNLHGAMAAEDDPDFTGTLLERVRAAVGPDVPIVGSFDLHANITRRMLSNADVLSGYHTSPHLDSWQTGERAARALWKILKRGVRPQTVWRKLPMFTAAEYHNTFTGPPAPIYERLKQLEAEDDVLAANVAMVMPWFDAPKLGWSVVLTTNRRESRWEQVVDQLCSQCWSIRHDLEAVERFSPEEVVKRALAHGGHPIVIGDGADATNSGSTGDSTRLLSELLAATKIPHGALTFMVDPIAVAEAYRVGVGGTFDADIGGRLAPEYSSPLRVRGKVERLQNVEWTLTGHISKNMPVFMGRGAVVRSGDVQILLVEQGGPGSSPRLYESVGLDPRTCGIVVAKSPAGFRADYDSFAAAAFLVDCPGCASPHWTEMRFNHVDRPLWPLTPIASPAEATWCESGWVK
jgi:microcystin degradation protein MlrC